jgi:hypothetical protein
MDDERLLDSLEKLDQRRLDLILRQLYDDRSIYSSNRPLKNPLRLAL